MGNISIEKLARARGQQRYRSRSRNLRLLRRVVPALHRSSCLRSNPIHQTGGRPASWWGKSGRFIWSALYLGIWWCAWKYKRKLLYVYIYTTYVYYLIALSRSDPNRCRIVSVIQFVLYPWGQWQTLPCLRPPHPSAPRYPSLIWRSKIILLLY